MKQTVLCRRLPSAILAQRKPIAMAITKTIIIVCIFHLLTFLYSLIIGDQTNTPNISN